MSMTQVALLQRAEIPSKEKIQAHLNTLGYPFQFTDFVEPILESKQLDCNIIGHATSFELYYEDSASVINEWTWLNNYNPKQDTVMFFVWGADFAAAACIGLICIALIDLSDANIYYLDDELTYTREMLVKDTPHYLYELEKQAPEHSDNDEEKSIENFKKYTWWQRLLKWFR